MYIGSDADAARLTYFGLFALQHRGQESAGISVSDGENLTIYKDLGLVAQVFDESTLAGLHGTLAIGHNRYSTTGSSNWENSQPVFRHVGSNGLASGAQWEPHQQPTALVAEADGLGGHHRL